MKSKPDVSVVLPVFNEARHIRASLESALSQTGVRLELIVVDDGSTDETPRILRDYADPRLRMLRNDRNEGFIASLNTGISDARADVIARLDADDLFLPKHLVRQLAVLKAWPNVGLVAGDSIVVDLESSRITGRTRLPRGHASIRFLLHLGNPIHHSTATYRKRTWHDVGGYRSSAWGCEDRDLWLRLSERSEVRAVTRPVSVTGIRTSGMSESNRSTYEEMNKRLTDKAITRLLGYLPAGLDVYRSDSLKTCAAVAEVERVMLDMAKEVEDDAKNRQVRSTSAADGVAHVLHKLRYRDGDDRLCLGMLARLLIREPPVAVSLLMFRTTWMRDRHAISRRRQPLSRSDS